MAARKYAVLSGLLEPSPILRHTFLNGSREYWVHPINAQRPEYGEYHHIMHDLKQDNERFHSYFRMFPDTFSLILDLIHDDVTKQSNGFRQPICAEERLHLTLRYLSTGMSFRSLAHSFRMGKSTVASIVEETVQVIWSNLSPLYVKEPNLERYLEVADMFQKVCQFPNVIGAIDGKHVRIEAPANSGSNYFNYKNFFSIVLQGVADPELKFIAVEVGSYGKESDGGIFSRSQLKRHLDANTANIPPDAGLPNSNIKLPYYLIGDSAYPLRPYLMTRINSNLTHDRRVFNYRHSRARRCVESAFGVLATKWRVLRTPIATKVDTAVKIVLACVALHNACIHHEGQGIEERDQQLWDDTQNRDFDNRVGQYRGRPGQQATWMREQLVNYFVGPGAVSWQEDYI